MISISLCMIVKNEEERIAKCLSSVRSAVDEIVIVDTGSTDRTKEIVRQYTGKIYDFEWIDDFSAARNESFAHATKDYILWLDADDILLPEDVKKLKQLKKDLALTPDVDCVHFIYHYAFDNTGKPSLVFRRERLVKRERNFRWIGFIHEYIETNGKTINADIAVTHTRVHGNADRNLNIFRKKIEEGVTLSVRDQYYYGKELYYHAFYEEAIQVLLKLLEQPCWIEDRLDAVNRIADCYMTQHKYLEARKLLIENLEPMVPRAEMLYRIGKTYQEEEKFEQAVYWYELIFVTPRPVNTPGFIFDEYWTWKPHLELCVCYYRLNQIDKSIEQNEAAATYVPDDGAVKFNREFFQTLKSK